MIGGEVDVDVGRALVVLVQESLEEQVVRNGSVRVSARGGIGIPARTIVQVDLVCAVGT